MSPEWVTETKGAWCALLFAQVLDGLVSSRLSATLNKACAFRAMELPSEEAASMCRAYGGRRGSAGTREGASAALHRRQGGNHGSCADHTLVPVKNRTAELIVDVPVPQGHKGH